jgi:hypothetical protein
MEILYAANPQSYGFVARVYDPLKSADRNPSLAEEVLASLLKSDGPWSLICLLS